MNGNYIDDSFDDYQDDSFDAGGSTNQAQARQEFIRNRSTGRLHAIVEALTLAAEAGNISAARLLLGYHAPAVAEVEKFIDLPDLARLPVERRLDALFKSVALGALSLDSAERLAKLVSTQVRQEETLRFLDFLRQVSSGADPVQVARSMAKELHSQDVSH